MNETPLSQAVENNKRVPISKRLTISAEILRRISNLNLKAPQLKEVLAIVADIGAAAEALASAEEDRRTKDRERKRSGKSAEIPRKFQAAIAEIPEEIPSNLDGNSNGNSARAPKHAHALVVGLVSNIPPSDTTYPQTPSEKPKPLSRKSKILDELKTVLDPEIAAGVIEHRCVLRKPLTLLGAHGLTKAFAATGDPNAAARMMIERGWQGFKPEWFAENHGSAVNGARSPPPSPTTGQLMIEAMQGRYTEGLIRDGIITTKD